MYAPSDVEHLGVGHEACVGQASVRGRSAEARHESKVEVCLLN